MGSWGPAEVNRMDSFLGSGHFVRWWVFLGLAGLFPHSPLGQNPFPFKNL